MSNGGQLLSGFDSLVLISFFFIYQFLHFQVLGQGWVYKHTGETLHHLLNQEVGQKILELENPAFEKCYLGSGLIE